MITMFTFTFVRIFKRVLESLALASSLSVLDPKQPVLGNSVLGVGLFQSPWPWPRRLCPRRHLW